VGEVWHEWVFPMPKNIPIFKESSSAKCRVRPSKVDEPFGKSVEVLIFIYQGPIDPTGGIVLTPGIVVAILGSKEFIPSKKHWNSLGDK